MLFSIFLLTNGAGIYTALFMDFLCLIERCYCRILLAILRRSKTIQQARHLGDSGGPDKGIKIVTLNMMTHLLFQADYGLRWPILLDKLRLRRRFSLFGLVLNNSGATVIRILIYRMFKD